MAATSIASQLQALKSLVKTDTEVPKRPITRPSILFDPKEAADLDIDTILSTALHGLEVLVNLDERFRNYKNDLFSQKSRELDRELMSVEENNPINATITSYLRLLSGHLQSPSALRTLEYLIRRYKIHVYNIEELILCSLPYHDTHAFVRIMQVIDFGNSRWKFLDGVKVSGAPPPREVIVQQCIRDMSLLEVICNYATPAKKHQPSTHVISFCTAVVVEVLGLLGTVDSEVVKRILPFLNSGLQSGGKGPSDYKAGTLMIVSLLANKVSLSPKLVSGLVRSISELARTDALASADLQWVQLSIMALINVVQLQSVEVLPKKAVDNLKEIRDLPEVLSQLTKRFNVDRFLTLLLESLVDYSNSDSQCKLALVTIIETVAIGGLVNGLVFRLLSSCLRLSHNGDASVLSEVGSWAKQILLILNKKYPNELRAAVHDFLEDKKVQLKGEKSVIETLSKVLDGNLSSSVDFSESRIWFALDHPKAEIRRATLSNLDLSAILDGKVISQRLLTIQDAIIRCLSDNDLSVVQAALSLDRLPEVVDLAFLLETCQKLLRRCIEILWLGTPKDLPLAGEVAGSCLKHVTSVLREQSDAVERIATMLFPLLLVFPKTKVLNLKALELAKEIKWPFYKDLISVAEIRKEIKMKAGEEWLSEVNMTIVHSLVDAFSANSKEVIPWLIKCCSESELSKTIVFLVLLQSFTMKKSAFSELSTSYEACFEFLKTEWGTLEHAGDLLCQQEFDIKILDADNVEFLKDFVINNIKELNARILVFVFWRLVKAYTSRMPTLDEDGKEMHMLQDLYIFFSESNLNLLFKEHRHYLVENCKTSPIEFLSRFVSEQGVSAAVQVESLHALGLLCSPANEASGLQLLAGFPLILVPLSSDMLDVRRAAMNYVEELSSLCSRVKLAEKKNGNSESWSSFVDELLNLLVQQKKLIVSDGDYLPSFLAAILSPSFKSLLVPQDVGVKFEKSAIDCILAFILGSAAKFSGYAKLKILSLLKELGSTIVQVKDVECLLSELLQRRLGYHFRHDKSYQELTSTDVDILCLLIEICSMPISFDARVIEKNILSALWMDGVVSDAAAIVRPCVTFLQKLNGNIYRSLSTEMQQNLFRQLVLFYHDANTDVQNATREALLRLDISCSTVAYMVNSVLTFDSVGSTPRKKKKTMKHHPDMFLGGGDVLSFLSSLLDVLLLKKDIESRVLLVEPLFKLLGKAFSNEWFHAGSQEERVQASSGISQTMSNAPCYIQQTLLLILEDIVTSLPLETLHHGVLDKFDAALLVDCARSTADVMTRNHVYSLFAAITKVEPDKVLPQIPEIIAVIGDSAVSHSDSHSRRVFEDFISTVVPCWLSKIDGSDKLLQIFINVMPDVTPDRRLSIVLHLLKTLGESNSLGSLLLLLFRSLVSKEKCSSLDDKVTSGIVSSINQTEWQYCFASQICEQYTCMIWLQSLVLLLKQLQKDDQDCKLFMIMMISFKFILEKLQDPEFFFKLQSIVGMETIQGTLCELMVQVVSCWQLVDSSGKKKSVPTVLKKELKEHIHSALMKTTKGMLPSAFFQGIIRLLVQQDNATRKKALQVLCETVRDADVLRSKRDRDSNGHLRSSWRHLEGSNFDSFVVLCLEILQLLDAPYNDLSGSVRLAAISALEVLANKFPSNHTVFSKSLACVVKNVMSEDLAVGSCCLRAVGALINVLGPRALPELPQIMKNLLQRTRDVPVLSGVHKQSKENSSRLTSKESIMLAILVTLEALVDNLGAFLNPYLNNIVELMVLHPDYLSESNQKLKSKADAVRRQLSEKVPVRLGLPAIQYVYSNAAKAGDLSLCAVFELLKNFVGKMDRASVSGYHANIFDLCMLALDFRSRRHSSIKNINGVEKHVIDAMITLTMKMTETMFKPLFIRSIEWAESNIDEDDSAGGRNFGRAVSFYGLVNSLAENHRSLFVPYFKYLLDSSIRYLTDDDDKSNGQSRKKKKAKKSERGKLSASDSSVLEKWNLRALIMSSLHKCFLYDTASLKFLDSSKFQLLLKPIVSQLVIEPPALLEEHPDIPSVKEVDDILVLCLGQMAVTAGSDLLWKLLNYEVLMQTRSEMVRSRLLGLRVVKYLVENLKEEYLVLLAETIPFLAELLEDVELPVKTLAQDILKELETMSGENLRQYF